ncbi:MAG: biotin transporter BioY, partial [Phycisphaerales bacterium JB059]
SSSPMPPATAPADAAPRHDARVSPLERRLLGMLLFTLLTTLGALVANPLPPDGVPMTLQTLAVILAALCLGPRVGAASMILYILVGMIGAGVFADGSAGLAVLAGQTGGYLVGFVLCQPVITSIIRRRDGAMRGWGAMILAVLAGHLVIFALGVPWLALVRGYSLARALEGGFYPFLLPMLLKCAIAVIIGRWAAPWAMRRIW